MKIKGYNENNGEHVKKYVEVWYNKHEKSWVIQVKDKHGYQIGNSYYQYTKPTIKELEKEYKLPVKFTK